MHTSKRNYLPYIMWLFPLAFFAYQFILRLWPGLIMQQLMDQFLIDASSFGLLAAFYYYGYSGMQIPVAILLDKYGARKIVFISVVLCGLSTLLLIYTNNFYLAILSRFLIGAGSAVGFLGVSKVVSQWFPQERYARMIGLSFTFGLIGAIYGGKPMSLLIDYYNWKLVAVGLALVALSLGVVTFFLLKEPKVEVTKSKNQFSFVNFKAILSSPLLWCLAISNLLMVGALEGFADVWGVLYLMQAYGFSKGDAAGLISCVFFGMLFGGPLLALFSKKCGNYLVITMCGLGMALAFGILLSNYNCTPLMLSVLFFLIGIMCCYQVLIFAAGSELTASENLGITVAFLNSINMLGGSFFHTLIGKAMDFFWTGQLTPEGLRLYDVVSYQYALAIIPLCSCLGALLVGLIGWKIVNSESELSELRKV